MKRREVLLTTAALVGASALPAYAATPKDVLVIADAIDDLISMDPAELFEFSGQDLLNNTYQQLFEFDPAHVDSGFKPGVIEKYEIADDGKTYTFEVRKGLKFHSGNPVTASDVVFSLVRAVKLNLTPSFILSQFGPSADNADQMIQKTGDYTLTMKVDQPYAPSFILNCLTAAIASVVDEKLAMAHEENGDFGHAWVKTNDAGSGPYRLVSWKPNESYRARGRARLRHRARQAQARRRPPHPRGRDRSSSCSRRATSTSRASSCPRTSTRSRRTRSSRSRRISRAASTISASTKRTRS